MRVAFMLNLTAEIYSDSPIHGMIGELKDSPTECNEYTLSTVSRAYDPL